MAVLLQVNVMAKILVCTHSNSAADIYIERLDKKLGHGMFSDQNVFLVQTFLFCFLTKVTFSSVRRVFERQSVTPLLLQSKDRFYQTNLSKVH